ncbi:MAG: hypothetical protein JNN22_10180 [Rhodospirillales bacterium]|nr:hypothetical protein [Rhodospirillales bacterium]
MSFQVMPSVFTPSAARAYAHPVAAPAVVADIQGRAESIRRSPGAIAPAPLPANATEPKVSFFA